MPSYTKDIYHALDVMLKPTATTKRMMDIESGFAFYYKVSVLSLVLFVVTSLIFNYSGAVFAVIAFAALYWIMVPLYIIIQSAIFQFVCNFVLKEFKRGYDETMAAFVYSMIPLLMLAWLSSVPAIGALAVAIGLVWALFILIIALSNLQRVSRLSAFVAIILTLIVEFVLFGLLAVVFALGVFGVFSGMLGAFHV